MPPEAEVLAANAAFYAAFRSGDHRALTELWSRRAAIACTHPGARVLLGRERVLGSFRAIMSSSPPPIDHLDATVMMLGETALVTCVETVEGARLSATNVFVHEEGAWRMVHHHAGELHLGVADRSSRELN